MTIPDAMDAVAADMEASGQFSWVEVGPDGLAVWAEFTNGWPYIVLGNRPKVADEVATERAEEALAQANTAQAGGEAVELPDTSNAVLLNGFANYRPATDAAIDEIDRMLSAHGYNVSQQACTVANLQNLGNAGVVSIHSHGYRAIDLTNGFPILWVSDTYNQEQANTFADLGFVENDYIAMISTNEEDPNTGASVSVDGFAVTNVFIQNEVSLPENSFVISQSCFSGVQRLVDAWLSAGAGVYAGWDHNSAGDVQPKFLVDRMTGANQYRPESPDQRPFDWKFAYTSLREKGLHQVTTDFGLFGGLAGDIDVTTATLRLFSDNDTGIMAPTIQRLQVEEVVDQLVLHGVFGSEEGEVTVAGVTAGIDQWEPREIRATIPRSGVGSAGPVKVRVRGHESNVINLTSWRMGFDYTYDFGRGDMQVVYDFDLHFRGDVSTWRRNPGEAPERVEPFPWQAAQDSSATYQASGSYTRTEPNGDTFTTNVVGSGNLLWQPSPEPSGTQPLPVGVSPAAGGQSAVAQIPPNPFTGQQLVGFRFFGRLLPEVGVLQLTPVARTEDITLEFYENGALDDTVQYPVDFPFYLIREWEGLFDPIGVPYIELQFQGSDYNIASGNWVVEDNDRTYTVEWDGATAQFPPDEDHAR
jgi:hypothetical protein